LVPKNKAAIQGRTKVKVVVGEADGLFATNKAFHELLDECGIEHTFLTVPEVGHQNGKLCELLVKVNAAFYTSAFGGL
jgi:enterochelin esterase-like enzyme